MWGCCLASLLPVMPIKIFSPQNFKMSLGVALPSCRSTDLEAQKDVSQTLDGTKRILECLKGSEGEAEVGEISRTPTSPCWADT